jgi:transposase
VRPVRNRDTTNKEQNTNHQHTMPKPILYVGLDVHARKITVATADEDRRGEVRVHSTIANTAAGLAGLLKKLSSSGKELRLCYEAGPCGYVLARQLAEQGIACTVAAPSLIPRGPGDHIKTDRRDAQLLARLHRAGELTAVHIPDATDEAIRDLCRARTDAVQDKRRAQCQLKAFLLRHGRPLVDKTPWSEARQRTLRAIPLPHAAQRAVLEEYILAIEAAHQRIARIEKQMEHLLSEWRQQPAVRALMGMRGFRIVAAMITVSELGDIHRFTHPRQLMAYLGLVPSENSSGESRRQGSVTKAGNTHLRWLINESAQNYRLPPRISADLSRRQEAIPEACRQEVKNIAWKCQNRLYEKGRRLGARGKMRQKVQLALARELCGFVWAVLKAAQSAPADKKEA